VTLQVCLAPTWMCGCNDGVVIPFVEPACQLIGKVKIRQFAIAVSFGGAILSLFPVQVRKVEIAPLMSKARQIYDSRALCLLQQGQEVRCQGKMPEMVRPELNLETILRFGIRSHHNASIVDQHIETIMIPCY